MSARVAELPARAVLHVTGEDAASFLDRVVTTDVDAVVRDGAGYGALLTPQGKVLTDFLMVRVDDGFLIDCPAAAAGDLLRRLTLYRLRAKVALEDASGRLGVIAVWNTGSPPAMPGRIVRDPRLPSLGYRAIVPRPAVGPAEAFPGAEIVDGSIHLAHVAGEGVPTLGIDAPFGEMFPHELAMDALHGIVFDKGCYVGQEVVSRMEHRATARRRPTLVSAAVPLPPTGTEVLAAGRPAGALGFVDGTRALAILRLDRVADALAAGGVVSAGGIPVTVDTPAWLRQPASAGGSG
jgi:folate-binding protein YgfZ